MVRTMTSMTEIYIDSYRDLQRITSPSTLKMPIHNGKGSLYGAFSVKVWCRPTEEKICAVLEANSPSTPTEVERFLGTVGVSA